MSKTIQSPCVRMCTLNEIDMCLGCGRMLNEITSWTSYSGEARNKIMQECPKRLKAVEVRTSPLNDE